MRMDKKTLREFVENITYRIRSNGLVRKGESDSSKRSGKHGTVQFTDIELDQELKNNRFQVWQFL